MAVIKYQSKDKTTVKVSEMIRETRESTVALVEQLKVSIAAVYKRRKRRT